MSDDDTIRRFPLNAKAWQEGYDAGRRGLQLSDNPHSVCTDAAQAWQFGLIEGQMRAIRTGDDK